MRLKLRVLDGVAGSIITDVDVTLDNTATAAELLEALARDVGRFDAVVRATFEPVLVIEADTRRATAVAGTDLVLNSGLRSGYAVSVASFGTVPARPISSESVTVTVTAGPDAPSEVRLAPGRYLIGRGAAADLRLRDPKVSVRHAWLVADGTDGGRVEIIDNGSANGTRINGVPVDRAEVSRRESCTVGSSTLTVVPAPDQPTLERGGEIGFIRSPRLDPTFVGPKLVAPSIPGAPDRTPFPMITTLAPLAMIIVYVMIIGSWGSMIFFVLMPLLSIGSWVEQRRQARRRFEREVAQFHRAVAVFADALDAAVLDETVVRQREQPAPDVMLEAARARRSILWTRRPEHERFGVIRIGRADGVSRIRIESERALDGLRFEPGPHDASNQTAAKLGTDPLETLLVTTIQDRRFLTDLPLAVDLNEVGNLGLAGRRSAVESVMRAVVVHLATLYSPNEMYLVALGEDRRRWMRWLPHGDAFDELATGRAAGPAFGAAYLQTLVDLVADRRHRVKNDGSQPGAVTLPRVVAFVDDADQLDRAALTAIAEIGPSVGVHLVWTAPTIDRIPAACRAFIDLHAGGSGAERGRLHCARLGLVDDGHPSEEPTATAVDFQADFVGADAAEWMARWLSPLVDVGVSTDRASAIPPRLDLLDAVGHDVADDPNVIRERWSTVDRSMAGLRCMVGSDGASLRSLDLRTDGPHALVAGTTGAGKSEFLQTWIVAMALSHPPEHFTILLVDYKGGSAFGDCQHLPHCVGLVTDLSPHLVTRALTSLRAELRRRERLFERLGVSDLITCEQQFPDECPPSLVIVVDEFAALIAEVPDFVTGVVDVAQRGRSLGLHLVLATQRPAGVITDQVRSNTNLRIALRMADTHDSVDVIGNADAAHFDPKTPGRAAIRLGSATPWTMQVAYVGGVTEPFGRGNPVDVDQWDAAAAALGHEERSQPDTALSVARVATRVAPNTVADLARMVATIRVAAQEHRPQRRPWLPELASQYRLEALPTKRTDLDLVIGVVDRPSAQLRDVLSFEPDQDGHMVLLGGGKSGKSTALRTIAAAAGWASVRGGPVHVYALQFGGRALDGLASLPHVAAVVNGTDIEHVGRTIAYLRSLIERRQHAFAAVAASSLSDYRGQSGRFDEPRIIVMVDGVGRFRDEFESGRLLHVYEQFVSLVADGRAVGVHVVVTAARPAELGTVIMSLVHHRVVLRLSDENDATSMGVAADFFDRATPPGRGWCNGDEVQLAILGGNSALTAETLALGELTSVMQAKSVGAAQRLDPAPVNVRRSDLAPPRSPHTVALGLNVLEGRPIEVDPAGVLIVAGPRGSGVSTTVNELIRELAANHNATCVLFGAARSALAKSNSALWADVALGDDDILSSATSLIEALRVQPHTATPPSRPMVVVIERLDDHLHGAADEVLTELLSVARDSGVFVIATAEPAALTGTWPLIQAARHERRGLVLRPDPFDVEAIFGVNVPRLIGQVPPGRGIYVHGDEAATVQVAVGVTTSTPDQP